MQVLTKCPICNFSSFTYFQKCIDYLVSREEFQIVQCTSCSFLFTNPRPDEESIGKYYESDEYISHSNSKKGLFNKVYQIVRDYSLIKKRKLIESFQVKDRTLLDIGCGTGEFLNTFKNSEWKVKGLEPSHYARNYAISNYKLNVKPTEEFFSLNPQSIAVITMWHVLEHVHELNKYIIQLKNVLADDGVLIVAVPNPESYDSLIYKNNWAAFDVPRHLNHFTKRTMNLLMERNGFSIIKIVPMKFDSYYVSMLSERNLGKSFFKMSTNGFKNGLKSNYSAKKNSNNYSSLIYIIQKV